MNTRSSEYQPAEVLQIGSAQNTILSEKNIPILDFILQWPLFWRVYTFGEYDEDELLRLS